MKLPINPHQKFQIGDICKIVRADNTFTYPPIKDEETEGYGCLIVIMYSYAQIFPHINPNNTGDFEVYLPEWLNPQMYKDGWYQGKKWSCEGEMSWAWVNESQLEFVRKPTKEEIKKIVAFGEQNKWKEYKGDDPDSWIWDSYKDLLEHYQEKIDVELNRPINPNNCIFINFHDNFDVEKFKEQMKDVKLVYEITKRTRNKNQR